MIHRGNTPVHDMKEERWRRALITGIQRIHTTDDGHFLMMLIDESPETRARQYLLVKVLAQRVQDHVTGLLLLST